MSMGKGWGGWKDGLHPGRHTCAFNTAEFNDLLNTKTRKRNHQNIPYGFSMVSTRMSTRMSTQTTSAQFSGQML